MIAKVEAITARFDLAQDRLVIQASDLSLETISSMVGSDAIDISPGYQRRERWTLAKERALVESFLLNIPVPPIYLFEEEYGKYSVIDGKQRVTAIHRFMSNSFDLRDLLSFRELTGQRFSDLPIKIQNALRVRPYVRVVTLLRQSDVNLKYEVFRRLNEGGEPLNAQEVRNVVFRGPLNELIYELSENNFLLQQLKIKTRKEATYQQMVNAEIVLRYFVLSKLWRQFTGSFRESMDDYMREHQHTSPKELDYLKRDFLRSIAACEAIFGSNAFRRPAGTGWREQFLTGMFDAEMVACSLSSDADLERAIKWSDKVVDQLRIKIEYDYQFEASIREATNTPSRIQYRIGLMTNILIGV